MDQYAIGWNYQHAKGAMKIVISHGLLLLGGSTERNKPRILLVNSAKAIYRKHQRITILLLDSRFGEDLTLTKTVLDVRSPIMITSFSC